MMKGAKTKHEAVKDHEGCKGYFLREQLSIHETTKPQMKIAMSIANR